ncbi:InlB B-repeat-containing protein [Hanstruepera ponticola]|uniref:InlB B-repeat-containing protein n=1 Tax=Hanstruepera ponticola TaxID=2042995 RepID=UPI000CF1A7B6|nr:InlB B-repeat-containing protein [Hanstruepera ponticola]
MIKKYSLVFLAFFSAILFGFGQSDIIISQYIETNSGSTPKGLEIMNVSGSDITFSAANNLQIYQGTNGASCSAIGGTDTDSGILRANEVWVIGTSDLVAYANINGTNLSGTTEFSFSFNGDDALQVRLGGVIQDQFGVCGSDPGSSWSGSGVSTANNNLQIHNGICDGDIDGWTDPSTRFDQISGGSTMTGFGSVSHTCSSTFSVTYEGNGHTGGSVPTDGNVYNSGDTVTVLGNTGSLINTCNTFNGWNTSSDGSGTNYVAGNTFTINANTILYAQWSPTGNTVTFNSNGGSGTMANQINCAPTNLDTNSFTYSGFTFNSWNTAADGSGTTYADGSVYNFSADITLYAQWDVFVGPCASESFVNSGNSSSYGTETWTGDDGIDWTATDSRTDQDLNGQEAVMLRNGSLTNVTSFPNGCGVITFDYARIYTGNSTLQVWINGIQYGGDITVSNTSSSTFSTTVNVSGFIDVELRNSGNRTLINNLSWTCFSCSSPSDTTSFTATSGCTGIDLSWDLPACADEVLIVARQTNAVTASPTGDGTAYTADTQFGNGTAILAGQFAVYKGTGISATITGLSNGNTYHFTIFSRVGTMWSTGVSDFETANLNVDNVASFSSYNSCGDIALTWSLPVCYDEVLVVARANNPVAAGTPTGDGTSYTSDPNFAGTGSNLLSGKVVFKGTTPPETITGLTNGVTYHFKIFTRIGTSWSSGITSSATAVSSGGSGPTTFIPGDLVFVGFDSYAGPSTNRGIDRFSILNMVDIGVGTEFTMANLLYEYNAPAGISTGRWYDCNDDFDEAGEPPYATLQYNGCSDIPKGSIICLETNSFPAYISSITVNGVDATSDFTVLDNPSHDNDNLAGNISTSSPDAIWLMQGTFTDVNSEPDGPDTADSDPDNFRTFNGVVLGGLQTKGNFQPFSVAGNAGGTRVSRIHPDIECVYLETGTTSNDRFYGYHNNMTSGTHYALLADITNVSGNWVLQSASSGQEGDDISFLCNSSYTITGSANIAGHWIGGVSTDWFDCKNWENFSVPKRDTNVIIDNASTTYCDIDHTSPNAAKYGYVADCQDLTISDEKLNIDSDLDILYVRNVTIQGTGSLDMNHDGVGTPGSIIYLYEDWTNNIGVNAFDEGNGRVVFTGDPLDGPQVINNNVPTNTEEFYNVTLDNNFDTSTSNNLHANGSLIVDPTNNVTVTDGRYIYVNNDFTNNGVFNINNNGSLVQGSDTGINTGNISVERSASVDAQDYVYWSSPITNMNVNNVSPSSPTNRIYKWNPTFANTNGTFGNWVSAAGETMQEGVGYIIRVPNGQTAPPMPGDLNFTANFNNGIPHNGPVPTLQVTRGAIAGNDDQWNLIGNPYPSAIDAYTFLDQNSSVLDGFVNLWTHGNPPTGTTDPFYYDFGSNYYESDYLTYNGMGMSSGPGDLYIASGQSFMVNMLETAPSPSNIVFSNTMRGVNHDNSQFYRLNNSQKNSNYRNAEKHRIWLDLISENQPANRILVGYAQGATQDQDRMFDAISDNLNFYSLIENKAFVIQGRGLPFNESDIIPLGFKSISQGNYIIAIADLDGMFDQNNQTIYLKDHLLGITHNLRTNPYSFVTEEGVFDNRFEIVFRASALSIDDLNFDSNNISIIELDNDYVRFKVHSNNLSIKNIKIIDLTGRLVYNLNGQNSSETFNLSNLGSSTYIAKITLSNNHVIHKKAIKK